MNNLVSKLFFAAGVIAYMAFFFSRPAWPTGDYSTDVMVVPLLGILGHFAFDRKAVA